MKRSITLLGICACLSLFLPITVSAEDGNSDDGSALENLDWVPGMQTYRRTKERLEQLQERTEERIDRVKERLDSFKESVQDAASSAKGRLSEYGDAASQSINDGGHRALQAVGLETSREERIKRHDAAWYSAVAECRRYSGASGCIESMKKECTIGYDTLERRTECYKSYESQTRSDVNLLGVKKDRVVLDANLGNNSLNAMFEQQRVAAEAEEASRKKAAEEDAAMQKRIQERLAAQQRQQQAEQQAREVQQRAQQQQAYEQAMAQQRQQESQALNGLVNSLTGLAGTMAAQRAARRSVPSGSTGSLPNNTYAPPRNPTCVRWVKGDMCGGGKCVPECVEYR